MLQIYDFLTSITSSAARMADLEEQHSSTIWTSNLQLFSSSKRALSLTNSSDDNQATLAIGSDKSVGSETVPSSLSIHLPSAVVTSNEGGSVLETSTLALDAFAIGSRDCSLHVNRVTGPLRETTASKQVLGTVCEDDSIHMVENFEGVRETEIEERKGGVHINEGRYQHTDEETNQGNFTAQIGLGDLLNGPGGLLNSLLFDGESSQPSTGQIETYRSGEGSNGVISDYNVDLIFDGNFSEELKAAFIKAADYVSMIITGDQSDIDGIDDIQITAELRSIDGRGGILGSAGPQRIRSENDLTTEGIMTFDVSDAQMLSEQGIFDDVVLHEMLHVLGFGTLWERKGLIEALNGELRFTGENAIAAYEAEFDLLANQDTNSSRGVVVEQDGGTGTAGGHWDEDLFENELMTGFASSKNYLSGMSIASLEDLGYETVFEIENPTAAPPPFDVMMVA